MKDKIISFSLWGNKPKYVEGALQNLELAKKYYPRWVLRFYIDKTVPVEATTELSKHAQVIYLEPSDGCFGLFWRFYPLTDPSIERFIVRDTDSRLNEREADAVQEWIESGKKFHIMRDHKFHAVPICGGMWGATNEFIHDYREQFDKDLKKFLESLTFAELYKARGKYFNTDQPFLWRYVWPRVINDHVAHIRDLPNLRIKGDEKLFRVNLEGEDFVGRDIDISK